MKADRAFRPSSLQGDAGSDPPANSHRRRAEPRSAGSARGGAEVALVQITLDRIHPSPLQPRRVFDPDLIEQLSRSIASQGVIQPLVVRPHPQLPQQFQLVAGERRLRALRLLGWPAAPAIVRAIRDAELLEAALVENLQREPLTPIEEAQALRDLMERHGYTQESLAARIGKDRSTISNLVRLLELPLPIQEDLEAGRLSAGHARALLAVPDTVLRIALRNEVLRRSLTVRETERLIRLQAEDRSGATDAPGEEPPPASPEFQHARHMLERKLGTRVAIHERDGQGRLEIEFYSLEDFNRLFDWLMGRGR